jgi:alkane 1-monooxygenase
MQKVKYLTVFLLPCTVLIAFTQNGWLTFVPLIVFFGLVPLLEGFLPPNHYNLSDKERVLAEEDRFYDGLLYVLVPVQWAALIGFLFILPQTSQWSEWFGRVTAMGCMCGIIGINIGHELGHRNNRFHQLMGELLLLTSLENHFTPYHNRGHHNQVATPDDPATARKNEPVYFFWFRSQLGSYVQAWKIELLRMQIAGRSMVHPRNKMVQYTLAQLTLLLLIYLFAGWAGFLGFLCASLFGILLLETVNYIEHYGLLRVKRENGHYERVRRTHSWNSNHVLGRVVLFELSRHSDHHYKPDRPYQVLETHEESPLMPTGYPGMMLLSLLPPVFFRVMNKRIPPTNG